MEKLKNLIKDNRISFLHKKISEILLNNNIDSDSEEIRRILEECVIFEYRSKNVVDLCNLVISEQIKFSSKKPKDMSSNERNILRSIGYARNLLELIPYRFIFIGGAILEAKTIFAKTHEGAWTKANSYTVDVRSGLVRSVLCIEVDGKDTGTLHNLNSMFTPKKLGKFNCAKADDLLPNWKDYK